jgi:membrane carboxypeptidase/penicillin-binding protein
MSGRELIGFPAVASAFYGKTVAQPSDPEYLSLLAMLEAPNRYHPLRQPKVNADRAARIQEQVRHSCREGCFEGSAPVPCKTEIELR